MSWRRFGPLAAAAVFGVLLLGTVAFAQPSPWTTLGQAYRLSAPDGALVARVAGLDVSRAELRISRALLEFNNSVSSQKISITDKAALTELAKTRALTAEAKRRGLMPSAADLTTYITQIRQQFVSSPDAAAHFRDFLTGIGQTEEEFFRSPFALARYGEAMAIGRLRSTITAGLDPVAANSAWDAFTTTVQDAAVLQIVDPALR